MLLDADVLIGALDRDDPHHRHARISVPDAYCLATARQTGSAVASFDPEILGAAKWEGIQLV